MFFGNDRNALRRSFHDAWKKRVAGMPLEPLEAQIAQVVERHPEYHAVVEDEKGIERDFAPEDGQTNPFLHMAMHMALGDQRATDRPPGIAAALSGALGRFTDAHELEHAAMECLGRALWEGQRAGRPPDDQAYLECIRSLARQR